MTSEKLAGMAGMLLSLVFSYIPGIREKYDALDTIQKQLVMLASLAAVTGVVFGLSCAGVMDGVTCTKTGAIGLLQAFISALVANQSTYLISPVLFGRGVSHTA